MMHTGNGKDRRTWSYFNTPLRVYLAVMLPICALMSFLIIVPQISWVRASAAVVLAFSLYGFLRGYVRRLTVDSAGVRFRSLAGRWLILWRDVKQIGLYCPSGAVNGALFVFVTTQDRPPLGKWEIDSQTFQLQDRPGLLDALQNARRIAMAEQHTG